VCEAIGICRVILTFLIGTQNIEELAD
jgi:hypothetical protein